MPTVSKRIYRFGLAALCAAVVGVNTSAANATTRDEQSALELASRYSKAWLSRDVDTLVLLSHPIFAIREGGEAKYRASLVQQFEHFKDVDFTIGEELLGQPSEELILGKSRMIGIPAIRKIPGLAVTPFVYVLVSYDEGHTWNVVSLTCTDQKWLEALVPGYRGTPDILGSGNPALASTRTDAEFDEAMFLNAPRVTKMTGKEE